MKSGSRFGRFSGLTALLLFAAACVRFKPPLLDEPAAVLERFLFCASVEPKDDWAEPGPARSVFTAGGDGQIFAFVGFRDLRGPHALSWRWYGPTRALRRATEAIRIGEEGKSYASYIAWDAVPLAPDGERGVWTVVLFLDEAFLASKDFEVRAGQR